MMLNSTVLTYIKNIYKKYLIDNFLLTKKSREEYINNHTMILTLKGYTIGVYSLDFTHHKDKRYIGYINKNEENEEIFIGDASYVRWYDGMYKSSIHKNEIYAKLEVTWNFENNQYNDDYFRRKRK
jgi:hypothetical protein